jgi:hypothetical protein
MYLQTKIKLAAVAVFALFACIFYVPKGTTQMQTETAGQHFKNIKVLSDLPSDQLGKVMSLFAASLGKDCNFCHEGENFDKDVKKPKEDARKMIKMMMSINKDNFNSRPQVTCNSCHNGHEQPTNVPNLNPAAEPERPKQPATKPTVDEIFAKYIAALGGADKLAKVTSLSVKASRVEPDGKTIEPEMIYFKGNKFASDTIYPTATISERYDGTTASKFGGLHASIPLKADEIEQIKRTAEFFSPANLKAIYPKMDYRFMDKIDGREVYVVIATTASNQRETLYFEVATGLLIRRTASSQTMFGRFVYQVDYDDYKLVGGVRIPMTIKHSMPSIRWTTKVIEVKVNAPIDDAKFMAPAGS